METRFPAPAAMMTLRGLLLRRGRGIGGNRDLDATLMRRDRDPAAVPEPPISSRLPAKDRLAPCGISPQAGRVVQSEPCPPSLNTAACAREDADACALPSL